jgi:tRNA threonylcarbamoyladenosine biosynthesis protein TsaB
VRILGLDTATRRASVGLLVDGEIVAERFEQDSRHAVSLLPLIDGVLRAGNCSVRHLDAVAVSCGPGSFTGLRVGLSVAKGLACATGVPLVEVPTLEALARTVRERHGVVAAVLDARKGEVYSACFASSAHEWRRLSEDRLTTAEAFAATVPTPCSIIGDAVIAHGDLLREQLHARATVLPWETHGPRAATIAAMGAEQLRAGQTADLAHCEPFYICPTEAERKMA